MRDTITGNATVALILRQLQALCRRYRAAGRLMEAKAVRNAIGIVRGSAPDPPDHATRRDCDVLATTPKAKPIPRL